MSTAPSEPPAVAGTTHLAWYLRRLRRMSPREIVWRTSDYATRSAWRLKQAEPDRSGGRRAASRADGVGTDAAALDGRAAGGVRFGATLPPGALDAVHPQDVQALAAAAAELLDGRWKVLGVTRCDLVDPDWFLDPITGIRAPERTYCFRVNHRDMSVVGDVKQVWELSRHHHVTLLASAWALTGDDRYAERAAAHLRSWWRQNPFLSGVHWTSGIEIGIRLIAWVWTRRLLDGWEGAGDLFERNAEALRQIRWHQEYLATFRSRGSSANNHVVAEAAGQLVAALGFPWFPESGRWAQDAARLLEDEIHHNTFPSGVDREMASDYHALVAELGLLAAAEADLAGRPLSGATWRRLAEMVDVAAACLDSGLAAPRQGDSDDGRALVVSGPESNRWSDLLGLGAALWGPCPWWPASGSGPAVILVSSLARPRTIAGRPATRPWHYPDAGLTILRADVDGREIWCRCDGGPHGFLSIAAHAHADALSVEVRHDGAEILTDPGTYCYGSDPAFRRYFRSTVGHNTLEIGDRDQSVPGGPTMWMRHARSRELQARAPEGAAPGIWEAEHDGYTDLQPPAVHRRRVELHAGAKRLDLLDVVETQGDHPVRLAFHIGPSVSVRLDGNHLVLGWKGRHGEDGRATMDLPSELAWTTVSGSEGPVLGWYSPRFGERVAATDVIGVGSTAGGCRLLTRLTFGSAEQ